MANQQLVEYIKQQVQLGVSKDAVKSTLVQSGWPESDIIEAMDVALGQTAVSQPARSVATDIMQPKTESAAIKTDTIAIKRAEPTIQPRTTSVGMASPADSLSTAPEGNSKSWKAFILPALLILIILGMGVWVWMLSSQNSDLNNQLINTGSSNSTLAQAEADAKSKVSNLESQMASKDADLKDLALHVSVLIPPPVTGTSSPAAVSISLSGSIKADEKAASLTTSRNLVLSIKNYKEANVMGALKPLVGTTAKITGTTIPGSKEIIVQSVNDVAVPTTTASTQATTTPASPDPSKPIVP